MNELLDKIYKEHKIRYIVKQYPHLNESEFDDLWQRALPLSRKDLKGCEYAWLYFLPNAVSGKFGQDILTDYFKQIGRKYIPKQGKADGFLDNKSIEIKTSLISVKNKLSFNQVRISEMTHYCLCFCRNRKILLETTGEKLRQFGSKPSKSEHKQCIISEDKLCICGDFILESTDCDTIDWCFEEEK